MAIVALATFLLGVSSAFAQKTDVIYFTNGNAMTGEIWLYDLGQVDFSTHAMGTTYVRWTTISTIKSDKLFEIEFSDGSKKFGSLVPGLSPDSLGVVVQGDTTTVLTQNVVQLTRTSKSFWRRMHGNFNLGADFTQQDAKFGTNFNTKVAYKYGLRGMDFTASGTFSRQDSVANISKHSAQLGYTKEFGKVWLYGTFVAAQQSSQMSLDYRYSVAADGGRYFIRTNTTSLTAVVGLMYSVEQFTGDDPDTPVASFLGLGFDYFSWEHMTTTVSLKAAVIPILSQLGRVRLAMHLSLSKEIVKNFTVTLYVSEAFDSDPGSVTANKNDFTVTTSVGWTF